MVDFLGTEGDDDLVGSEFNDTMLGDKGNDYLCGFRGNDLIRGQCGDDEMYGGNGDDILRGGDGNDKFDGASVASSGDDFFVGGKGEDEFYFYRNVNGSNHDRIADMTWGDDTIIINGQAFSDRTTFLNHIETLENNGTVEVYRTQVDASLVIIWDDDTSLSVSGRYKPEADAFGWTLVFSIEDALTDYWNQDAETGGEGNVGWFGL